jgi:hypothetical protein
VALSTRDIKDGSLKAELKNALENDHKIDGEEVLNLIRSTFEDKNKKISPQEKKDLLIIANRSKTISPSQRALIREFIKLVGQSPSASYVSLLDKAILQACGGGRGGPQILFYQLWKNHPYPNSPCDPYFVNQCAIRMTVALEKSGIDTSGFDRIYPKRRCSTGYSKWKDHKPGHILAAQELANWLETQVATFGKVDKKPGPRNSGQYAGRKGIVFIKNGWGPTDHIDVWDGSKMKGGSPEYFSLGQAVWFWELK